ncbi:CDP-diacylglycerol--glycerol-3-phosphate 3-phosphatidyltransferase [Hydrogenophilus thermoluteolus]|nr:CDP-diacylglycerol--glycerol-3-phosphate 3-phosphatidyltransferase [Hydrogenophilus thermoluteolus]MBW7656522.1 CDP-diacylglycerol--glycerol-3-phosphate 3-phosphatidyltransferase [Hydrogenophilus thermoluteolus]
MRWNWPNLLTWLRIAAIPLLVLLFYLPTAWVTGHFVNLAATVLFVAASVTDWLDGYLARKLQQQSAFGAFLDPVADKLMVAAALVVLVDLGRADAVAALIIIGREITVSALREWMALVGEAQTVAVAFVGKLKTATQMVAIPFLLYADPLGTFEPLLWGRWLLWLAAVLTIVSMIHYLCAAWPVLRKNG